MLEPILDRVLIAPLANEKSAGGILVSKEPPTVGIVRACGRGKRLASGALQPLPFKVGDKVAFNASSGQAVRGEDQTLICMTEDDILAVIED